MSYRKVHSTILLFSLIGGVFLRLYFIFTRDIFTDEVFYFNVARSSSWLDIIKMNHWIKDHPQLYLLFLKLLSLFSQNIIWLRLSNILIYILCCYFLYQFFIKLKLQWIALLSIFLFSFWTYFVYLSCQLSPYNLALFFTCLSFFTFVKIIKDLILLNIKAILYFSILLSATFYSDYTAVYFYLTYIPVAIYLLGIKALRSRLILLFLINFILIIPGLMQINTNLSSFVGLNNKTISLSMFELFKTVANILFFRSDKTIISVGYFIGLIIGLLFIIFGSKSQKRFRFLSGYCLFGILIGFFLQYCLTISFISVLVERTYWFYYLLIIISFALIGEHLRKINRTIFILYLLLIIFLLTVRFKDNANHEISGRVPDQNIQYEALYKQLKPLMKASQQLIFIDKNYRFIPLSEYYFKDLCQDRCIRKTELIDTEINKNTNNRSVYVLLNGDEIENKSARELVKLNNNWYFSLQCDRLQCQFIQLN